MAQRTRRDRFWVSSILMGTAIVFVGGVVVWSSVFLHDDALQEGQGIPFGQIATDIGAAIFWSGLVTIGTCYVTIPVATLVVAAVRCSWSRRRAAVKEPRRGA